MKIISTNYFKKQFIKEVIDNFDWERVNKIMNLLGWEWSYIKKTPEIDELQKMATTLLSNVWDSTLVKKYNAWSIKSGGLKATASYNAEKRKIDLLKLEFILTDSYKEEE